MTSDSSTARPRMAPELPPTPAVMAETQKMCRYCGEAIRVEATLCRFCGRSTKTPQNPLALWAFLSNLLGVPIGSALALSLGYKALRQIRAADGQQGGRGLALAGVIWGWSALAIVALVLAAAAISASTRIELEDVRQQVADVAFAQQVYFEQNGRYAEDPSDLLYESNGRIDTRIFVSDDGDEFCVDGSYDRYRVRTWEDQFADDGTISTWSDGLCNGTSQPELTEGGPDQLQLKLDMSQIVIGLDWAEASKSGRNLAFNAACYDAFENRMDVIAIQVRSMESSATLTPSVIDEARDLVNEYHDLADRQWNC